MTARFALVGDPVAHSVSPPMHRAAFEALGLDLDYEPVRVPAGLLPEAWPGLARRYLGLNVTIPHKEAVIGLLDELAVDAARIGSVNTVAFAEGRSRGSSTDGPGFLTALLRAVPGPPGRALVLGAGGSARAVAAALAAAGVSTAVSARRAAAAAELAAALELDAVAWEAPALAGAVEAADVVVNATPVGAWPHDEDSPLPEAVPLHSRLTVFDLVYRPRRTALLRRAEAAGCRTVEGIEMLVEQGALSFEIWTGLRAPARVMREAALRALEEPVPAAAKEAG